VSDTAATETVSAFTGQRPTGGHWSLTVVHCPAPALIGQRISVEAPLCIGRRGDSPFGAIDDPCLSRRHALIEPSVAALTVTDQDSHNGISVNGKKVKREAVTSTAVLRCGDTLLVADRMPAAGPSCDRPPELVGSTPVFLEACCKARAAAASGLPILLLGDTGVGKEVFARAIHGWSGRKGVLVALNMAALPSTLAESELFGHTRGAYTGAQRDHDGAFARADGGTLLLDEIGELPFDLQPKLLRALETQEITPLGGDRATQRHAAILSATNSDLEREVEAHSFRRDLYARLAGVVIHLPRLADRLADVGVIARHFAAGQGIELGCGFLEEALLHDWPMNVRELRTVVARAALLGVATVDRTHFRQLVAERRRPKVSRPHQAPPRSQDRGPGRAVRSS
jgi:transcriptional regulator with GAF, ATPase, and Fis domain